MSTVLDTSESSIEKALELLNSGEVIAIPTETVYGLAASAMNPSAVEKIFYVKGRPSFNPIISHYADLSEIFKDLVYNERAEKLAEVFWPGPLTLILNKTPNSRISDRVCAGLNTAGVRIPRHNFTLDLLERFAAPVAAPSANPSGRLRPSTASHVLKLFDGRLDWSVDGGKCECGLESTVLDLSTDKAKILRYGSVLKNEIEAVIGKVLLPEQEESIKSPGMLLKHYAPKAKLRLNYDFTTNPLENEALICFGDMGLSLEQFKDFKKVVNISPNASLTEAAANLFSTLHELDALGFASIAIMPIPDEAVGKAINDRLVRAART